MIMLSSEGQEKISYQGEGSPGFFEIRDFLFVFRRYFTLMFHLQDVLFLCQPQGPTYSLIIPILTGFSPSRLL